MRAQASDSRRSKARCRCALLAGTLIAAMVCLWPASARAQEAEITTSFVETLVPLGAPREHWAMLNGSDTASPDSRHLVYQERKVKDDALMINGEMGDPFREIYGPVFSPDSKRIAWAATKGGPWKLIVNNEVSLKVRTPVSRPMFSPDSARLAIWSREGKSISLIIDKQMGPTFTRVVRDSLRFSRDSVRHAYVAGRDGRWHMVVDGEPGPGYDIIGSMPEFSPDGARLAFAAGDETGWWVVVDGAAQQRYAQIGSQPSFSPDSNHLAYWAQRAADGTWVLVVDGEELAHTVCAAHGGETFSPDAQRIAAVMRQGDGWVVSIDGEAGERWDAIGQASFRFSPDSQRHAYGAMRDGRWTVVVDGEAHELSEAVSLAGMQFSPDSAHFVYAAKRGERWRVVFDGEDQRAFETIVAESIAFSADGGQLVYIAGDASRQFVVRDGEVIAEADEVRSVAFSPSGEHLAWLARDGHRWRMYINGEAGGEAFEGVVNGAKVVFSDPRRCHTLVYRRPGPAFFRLEVTLPGRDTPLAQADAEPAAPAREPDDTDADAPPRLTVKTTKNLTRPTIRLDGPDSTAEVAEVPVMAGDE